MEGIKDAKTVHLNKILDGALSKHFSKHSLVYGSTSVVMNGKQNVTDSGSDKAENLRCSADSCSLFNFMKYLVKYLWVSTE